MTSRIPRLVLAVLASGVSGLSCRSAPTPTPPQYEPAENLLTIVAEFQRYRDADLYRFPYPRDVSGQNVFKATLVRLSNYQTLYPKKYGELIAYTRAQAYARLGDYETAIGFCKKAAAYKGDLAARAGRDLRILEDFRQASALPRKAQGLGAFRTALEQRVQRCRRLVERYPSPPWHALAQIEYEQAEVDLAEFIWVNRQVIPDGPRQAFDLLEAIRKRHRESKNYYRHTMRLGDWAYETAAQYAVLFPPERAAFAWDEFERWAAKAKSYYLEVAQSFGAQERTEASAKLAALEALEHRIREMNR